MVHAEKLGRKSNKAWEVEEELGFGEEVLQWMYVFPANSQQKPEEVKEEAMLLFLGNRKSGRGKGWLQALIWRYDLCVQGRVRRSSDRIDGRREEWEVLQRAETVEYNIKNIWEIIGNFWVEEWCDLTWSLKDASKTFKTYIDWLFEIKIQFSLPV